MYINIKKKIWYFSMLFYSYSYNNNNLFIHENIKNIEEKKINVLEKYNKEPNLNFKVSLLSIINNIIFNMTAGCFWFYICSFSTPEWMLLMKKQNKEEYFNYINSFTYWILSISYIHFINGALSLLEYFQEPFFINTYIYYLLCIIPIAIGIIIIYKTNNITDKTINQNIKDNLFYKLYIEIFVDMMQFLLLLLKERSKKQFFKKNQEEKINNYNNYNNYY